MGSNVNRVNRVNPKRKNVTLSFNDSEYKELVDKAKQIGLSPSTVARRLLLEHIRFFAN
jgi:hypothetical protein